MKTMKFRAVNVWGILLPFLFVLLTGPEVFAKGKSGGGTPSGFEKGEKKGWGESEVPPGWSHGEKKGWGEAGTPPGLTQENEG